MARISTYVVDGTIVDEDKVIGSDANNSMITKNYTVGDLAAYIGYSIGNNLLVPYVNATQNVDLGAFNLTANSLIVGNQLILGGTAGLVGQVLMSNGSGSPASWTYNIGSQTLRDVLNQGNTGNKNLILSNTTTSTIALDLEKLYGANVGLYVFDNLLNSSSALFPNKLDVQESSLQKTASYSASGIRYSNNGNNVDVRPNNYANQTLLYPSNGGVLVTSVNGNVADLTGNVLISGLGLGTVTSVSVTPGTGISASVADASTTPNITITNTAPDQVVVLNEGAGISVTGTYPNFTINATGTSGVSSVTATSPLFSSGGATPNITIQQASGSQDGYLSSGDWTIFNGKFNLPSLTTGSVLFSNGTTIAQDNANFFWDDSNNRLGIGTATPGYKLDVNGEINTNNGIRIGTNNAQTGFYGGANIIDFWAGNNKISTWGLAAAGGTYYDNFPSFTYNTGDTGITSIFKIRGNVTSNSANAAGLTQLNISPQYTQQTFGTGPLRGIYYNPSFGSGGVNTSAHVAFENASGDNAFNSSSGKTAFFGQDIEIAKNPTGYTGYSRIYPGPPLFIGGLTTHSDTVKAYLTLGVLGGNNMTANTVLIRNLLGDVSQSAAGTYTNTQISGKILSVSGNPEHRFLDIRPSYDDNGNPNTYTGIIRGVYYNLTKSTPFPAGASNIAWENVNGDIIHGNLATGGADEMVTVDTSGKLKKQTIPSGGSSPLTTKGDLYTFSTVDARLGVGSNGEVLIADSSTTTGLRWGTATSGVTGTGTINEIAYFNTTGSTIASLPTATYPSLTELSYVKGVTSAIQTQINGKASLAQVDNINILAYQSLGSTIKAATLDLSLNRSLTVVSIGAGNAQRLFLIPVYIPVATTITGVKFMSGGAGNFTASTYNGFGLYSFNTGTGTATLLTQTADDANMFKQVANVLVSRAFTTPGAVSVSSGLYYVGFVVAGTIVTPPSLLGTLSMATSMSIYDFTNSGKLFCHHTGFTTSLPSSWTHAANTTNNPVIYWVSLY